MHTFKQVLGADSTQEMVFDRVGMPLVEDLLAGKNGMVGMFLNYAIIFFQNDILFFIQVFCLPMASRIPARRIR